MSWIPILSPTLLDAALEHLQIDSDDPGEIVAAWTRRVPWETATRIARVAVGLPPAKRGRDPELFWHEAISRGAGGACFESNLAMAALLRSLGHECELTVNDLGEGRRNHAAVVVRRGRRRIVIDPGIPVYAPVPLDGTSVSTPWHDYHAQRLDGDAPTHRILRTNHPIEEVYRLTDRPVDEATFRADLLHGYAGSGRFVDRLIVHKVLADGWIWRYAAGAEPMFERFRGGERRVEPIDPDDVADTVAARFAMDRSLILIATQYCATA